MPGLQASYRKSGVYCLHHVVRFLWAYWPSQVRIVCVITSEDSGQKGVLPIRGTGDGGCSAQEAVWEVMVQARGRQVCAGERPFKTFCDWSA